MNSFIHITSYNKHLWIRNKKIETKSQKTDSIRKRKIPSSAVIKSLSCSENFYGKSPLEKINSVLVLFLLKCSADAYSRREFSVEFRKTGVTVERKEMHDNII